MDVRKKLLMGIAGTLVGLIAMLYVFSYFIVLSDFDRLESNGVQTNVERAMRALSSDLETLDRNVGDWSAWDDTYQFMEDQNEGYHSNLTDDVMVRFRLTMIAYISTSGEVLLEKGWDHKIDKEVPLPASFKKHLSSNPLLLQHPDQDKGVKGIIQLPEGYFLVASRAILTSEVKGPSRGSLIMGRELDTIKTTYLAEMTKLNLSFLPLEDSGLPEQIRRDLSDQTPILVRKDDERSISGYALIRDIYGKPSLVLKVDTSRQIHQQGQRTIRILILAMAAASGILFPVVWFMMGRLLFVPLNRVIEGIAGNTMNVSSKARRLSLGGQQLADGASRQVACVEETSSSLEEMAAMTRQNAEGARQADILMVDMTRIVDEATGSMADLTNSMQEISISGQKMQKIIKTIDEIAFQTNLLALNAAVEAARAGEAGAGFAVVAGEVRSLAMRAAEAARSTTSLIEETSGKIRNGSERASHAGKSFANVAQGSKKTRELVGEIAAASGEQAQGIEQINKAMTEIDRIAQENTSHAEESASASEEMSSQVEQILAFVEELMHLIGSRNGRIKGMQDDSGSRH